jgi:hypothetical protein
MSWNEEFSNSSHSLGQDKEMLASMTSNSNSSPAALFPLPGPNRAPESIPSEIFNTGSSLADASQQSYTDSHYVDFNLDSSVQLVFGLHFFPKIGDLTPVDIKEMNHQLFGVLREYPSIILQRDHWSPFVHHRMYRCSMGGTAKPMGIALACVSAHAGSSGSNYGFVDGLINQQREQLIREFQSYLDTPERMRSLGLVKQTGFRGQLSCQLHLLPRSSRIAAFSSLCGPRFHRALERGHFLACRTITINRSRREH